MIQQLINFILGLFGLRKQDPIPDDQPPFETAAEPKPFGDPAWLKLAKAELGVAEIPGEKDNPRVVEYFKDAGHGWVKDDETAWCAGFVGAMLERSGYASSKSLAARSYLTWGKTIKKPKQGCVVVFSRGNPNGWTGHVGFWVGETAHYVLVLGGNQSNKVSIAKYPKSRLLGYRVPVTAFNSRTNISGVIGATTSATSAAAVAAFSVGETLNIANTLKSLGEYWWLIFLALSISVFAHFFSIWARADDLKNKGR